MTVIDNVAPCKIKRVKGKIQNWFDGEILEKRRSRDGEILEKRRSRDKLFKAFKKTRLHIYKELYKKTKYKAQKLFAAAEDAFFDEKLSQKVGQPKKL